MRRFFVPEVVGASAMDCGPAALHSLLRGYGIASSYGRLREACQTDIDGTSIDTLEAAAAQLGLEVEQVVLPAEHALLFPAETFPAIVVTSLPSGATHFVVLWRKHGRRVQIMDPSVGRRWVQEREFRRELYNHRVSVPAADWREFGASPEFQRALRHRLQQLGIAGETLLTSALASKGWRELATLDAGVRLVDSLVTAKAVNRGRTAERVLWQFLSKPSSIPAQFWTATPSGEDEPDHLWMRGAVLVKVLGRQPAMGNNGERSPGLAAVRSARRRDSPFVEVLSFLRGCGFWKTTLFLVTPVFIALTLLTEALLFRGLFDIAAELGLAGQRFGAFTALILFSALILTLEVASFASGARLSRLLENQLRIAFLRKLPRLGDRFLQSRLLSDMAERCHAAHRLRHMPDLVRQLLHGICELGATAFGVYWLDPATGPFVLAILAAVAIPAVATQSVLIERDLRARTHAGGLTRFYLDAMAGLTAIRAHVAERTVLRQHEKLVGEWAQAALRLQRLVVRTEAIQTILLLGLVASLLLFHPLQGSDIGRALLVVYWALNLPAIGQEIGAMLRQVPYYRNLSARMLEPLGAAESQSSGETASAPLTAAPAITFQQVRAQASGHTILDGIDLAIEGGQHIAIVGRSGAGKSSLAGLLLGWLQAHEGEVLVDGKPLDLAALRASTAWVDPAVQLWNQSLYDNIGFGSRDNPAAVGEAIDRAMLRTLLETLPDGLQSKLGEAGGTVSGGEGQRVRLARALLRPDAKLVILDEPFRGLDREKRRELLGRARALWSDATLLCITHDLGETQAFDRVLVLDGGKLVEDGKPSELLLDTESCYSQMMQQERRAADEVWGAAWWRRIHLHSGRLLESTSRSREDLRPRESVLNRENLA